ncbi:unnamed protein product [Lactuca saligna]|uniref:Uncharacterized protein n=1 Tax=Lactuca saligna TaxID=75948 RepID=A0AA36EKD9_LACSI|nr:unnamed protein product [Lactuca saligna]
MSSEMKKEKIDSKEEEAAVKEIWKYVLGFTPMAIVKCAIELRIPDILQKHDTPMTLAELASELGCSSSSLYRIMRHGKQSMADFVLLESSPVMLAPWHKLSAMVLGSQNTPFEAAHGVDLWKFASANSSHSKLINDAMACDARNAVRAVIGGCPEVFEGLKTVVDVGGGDGTALGLIVEGCPWIKGINFDLPHVVSVAPAWKGVQHVGGSMFDHIPKADAAYLMKVLHDWGDDECIDILRKCREAIPKDTGKVIIVESIVGLEENHEYEDVVLMLDMVMIAHTSTGKERTLKEWSCLFDDAGFTRYTIKQIRSFHSVIEVYP